MFSRFRKTDPETINEAPPTAEAAPATPGRSGIAQIEMMGQTAIATLTVTELAQDHGARQLAELLDDMSSTGAQHYVLDMQNVQFLDSMCIGSLVEALNRLAAKKGRIALVNSSATVENLFRIIRLDRVFSICTDTMTQRFVLHPR